MSATLHRTGKKGKTAIAAGIVALLLSFSSPRPAAAQFLCEMPFLPPIVAAALTASQYVVIDSTLAPPGGLLPMLLTSQVASATQMILGGDLGLNMIDELGLSNYKPPNPCVPVKIDVLSLKIGGNICLYDVPVLGPFFANSVQMAKAHAYFGGLGYMDITMRARLDKFWRHLHEGMKAMTAQLYASGMNNARMIASLHDAGNLSKAGGALQNTQIGDRLAFEISDETCRYESTAASMSAAGSMGAAFSAAMSTQLNDIGHGTVGSPAAGGSGNFQRWRFKFYQEKLCDPSTANGGICSSSVTPSSGHQKQEGVAALIGPAAAAAGQDQPPALANAGSSVNAIFGSPTINMQDPAVVRAMQELTMNIIHYKPPSTYPENFLGSAAAVERVIKDREYVAQMDAISALPSLVIADFTPGQADENAQQTRLRAGAADASANPSEYELLQAAVSRLGDPKYFADIGKGEATAEQNELQLMAYNLAIQMKLNDYIERVATVNAIDAANMLRGFKDTAPIGGQ